MLLDNNSIWSCLCNSTKNNNAGNRDKWANGFMKVLGRLLSVQTENNWKVELKFLFYLKFKKTQHNNMQGIANKKRQTKMQLFFIFRI